MKGLQEAALKTDSSPDVNGGSLTDLLAAESFSRRQLCLVLGVLCLLTAIPRLLMAWQLTVICNDGYYYLSVARMWEQGQFEAALSYLNVNIYPLILWGLKSAGFAPSWGFKLWGVFVACLAVFPLFGLSRRLFDDRAACVTVFLFAIHPELIELSVEPIREQTFWFLFLLTAYLLHRCATSAGNFVAPIAAGIALACAVHTRTEGWALLVLASIWPISLAPAAVSRLRRTQRIVIVLAMIPTFLLVVNLTLLRNHSRWEWGRFDRLPNLTEWVQVDSSPTSGSSEFSESVTFAVSGWPSRKTLSTRQPNVDVSKKRTGLKNMVWFVFIHELCQSFEYINAMFLLVGLIHCGRRLLTRDKAPMLLMSCGILLAVWVRLIQFGDMNGRYFLTALLIALPTEAIGVIFLIERMGMATARVTESRRWRIAVPSILVLGFVALFWGDALTGGHKSRQAQAELGSRLRAEYGPFRHVETDRKSGRVGHYALGELPHIMFSRFQQPLTDPDLIITHGPVPPSIRVRARHHGLAEFCVVDSRRREFRVFARRKQSAAIAGSSKRDVQRR